MDRERKSLQMPVGGLHTRGNIQAAPDDTSPDIVNMVYRRGQVEKRPPILEPYTTAVGSEMGAIFPYTDDSNVLISGRDIAISSVSDAKLGATSSFAPLAGVGQVFDACEYDGDLFVTRSRTALTGYPQTRKLSGSTVTDNALVSRFYGDTICSAIGRLFIGAPTYPTYITQIGGNYSYAFNDPVAWTVSGAWAQPSYANNLMTATVANATTDKIKTAAAFLTPDTDGWVTAAFWIRSSTATARTPITLRIEDAAGTSIYGFAEAIIPKSSDDGEWRQYIVYARVLASTALYLSLQVGNTSGGGTVGSTFQLSDYSGLGSSFHCAMIWRGHFAVEALATDTISSFPVGDKRESRIVWSEALDPEDWRAESFADCDDRPGPITAIRSVNGKIIAFKQSGIWVFRPTSSLASPIVRERMLPGIGTYGPQSILSWDNKLVFVSENEIYVWDGAGDPQPICGEGMKDEVLDPNTLVDIPIIAMDEYNHELWVYTQPYKIFIYSFESNKWVGIYQLTDATQSETPFSADGGGTIRGMGWSGGVMYATYDIALVGANHESAVAYMDTSGATTYDTTGGGNDRDVKGWYTFHPIETDRPRKQITLQSVAMSHKITGSQANSVTTYAVSLNGGSTFPNKNPITVPVASGADADTRPIRAYVHQTAPRIVFRIEHNGEAGPQFFNMSDAEAAVIARGKEIQYPNPTTGGTPTL